VRATARRKWVVRPVGVSLVSFSSDTRPPRPTVPIPEGGAGVKYLEQLMIPGTRVSGVDVSALQRSWQHMRPWSAVSDAFPTVNGTGVSAAGRRT
jgi:hypothetical protein